MNLTNIELSYKVKKSLFPSSLDNIFSFFINPLFILFPIFLIEYNFREILLIAVNAGVKKVIPHVYSSIIDKETGLTKVEDVKALYAMIQEVVR